MLLPQALVGVGGRRDPLWDLKQIKTDYANEIRKPKKKTSHVNSVQVCDMKNLFYSFVSHLVLEAGGRLMNLVGLV